MSENVLDVAIAEAERFLQKAHDAKSIEDQFQSPKRSAARRASMDLTRALSALRRAPAYDWLP